MSQAMHLNTEAEKAHAPTADAPTSFMYVLMEAMEKDQGSEEEAQIVDAETAKLAADVETNLYTYYTNAEAYWAQQVADIDSKQHREAHKKSWKPDAAAAQAEYNKYVAMGQSAEGQQDGAVQAAQGQTSSDASNLQMKVQLAQGVESILATTSALLGRINA